MIYRYGVECPGCKAAIALRVSVGHDTEQPFLFLCGRCHTVIRGKQIIWLDPAPGARIEMEAAELLPDFHYFQNVDETISINPDLPARIAAQGMTDTGGSSFLHHAELLGSSFIEVLKKMKMFRCISEKDGAGLQRLGNFYLRQNWTLFCEEGRGLLDKSWPDPQTEVEYHDVLPRILLMAYSPLLTGTYFIDFVKEWNAKLVSDPSKVTLLREHAESLIANGQVGELQRQVLERLQFVVLNKSAILPALPAEFYQGGMELAVKELRLPRDDFDSLKGHYVDCYELSHKVLTVMVAMLNIIERGDANKFDPFVVSSLVARGVSSFKKISSLQAFAKQPNAPKRAFLQSLPVSEDLWNRFIERELRNAAGHYSARHDIQSGQILVDGVACCTYLEFVVKTSRMTQVLLCLMHVLKMCHMQKLLIGPQP